MKKRKIEKVSEFSAPEGWGKRYLIESKNVAACNDYKDVNAALVLAKAFIDPVLVEPDFKKTWSCDELAWL